MGEYFHVIVITPCQEPRAHGYLLDYHCLLGIWSASTVNSGYKGHRLERVLIILTFPIIPSPRTEWQNTTSHQHINTTHREKSGRIEIFRYRTGEKDKGD